MNDTRTPLPSGHSVDVGAAIAAAVMHNRSYDLIGHTEKAAVAYAAATMTDAIRVLCAKATEAGNTGIFSASGARLVALAPADASTRDFLLTHHDAPGAFMLTVLYKPDLTDETKAQLAAFDQRLATEDAARGISPRQHLLNRLMQTLHPDTSEGKERAALTSAPNARLPIDAETPIVQNPSQNPFQSGANIILFTPGYAPGLAPRPPTNTHPLFYVHLNGEYPAFTPHSCGASPWGRVLCANHLIFSFLLFLPHALQGP